MTLFVKYIIAILCQISLLFSTTGVSLLHHICLHMGHYDVSMFYGNVKEDACGNNASCCSSMDEAKDNSQQSFTMIDCCEDFTNYAVISVSFISQQIEKFSTNIFLNETNFLSNYQKLIDNSFNKIHVKPPGILKFPVSYIISFIIHSTDIGSELPA